MFRFSSLTHYTQKGYGTLGNLDEKFSIILAILDAK